MVVVGGCGWRFLFLAVVCGDDRWMWLMVEEGGFFYFLFFLFFIDRKSVV